MFSFEITLLRGDAPVVVMTTEVLRNMIYTDPVVLDNLDTVVLDEPSADQPLLYRLSGARIVK